MHLLRFDILLEQPLLVTHRVSDPNSMRSYDYIPGSTLRGLFAQRYLGGRHLADGASDPIFRRLFVAGAARFLNAYLLDQGGARSLPTPLALRILKGTSDTSEIRNVVIPTGLPQGRWTRASKSFCVPDAGTLAFYQPEHVVAVHVQRDPVKGRAWIERDEEREAPHGTVFRYEALAAGQWFGAAVALEDPQDRVLFADLIDDASCWLGRSRSATYGRVRLHLHADDTWREPIAGAPLADGAWTLTLLSDTILYNRDGDATVLVDDALLSAYLGAPVEVDPARTFAAPTLVGGFNRAWRTPVLQSPALAAGSTITFRIAPGTAVDTAALERDGIGDRREDGFGRVAFNWLTADVYQASKGAPYRVAPLASTPSTVATVMARRMAGRLLDQRIDQAIAGFIRQHVWPQVERGRDADGQLRDKMPSNSQLARLQRAVREALPSGDLEHVCRTLDGFRPHARAGYERARLAGAKGSLLGWIEDLLREDAVPRPVWSELGILSAPTVAGEQADLADDARAGRATLRLLMAVLAAPSQRRKSWEVVDASAE